MRRSNIQDTIRRSWRSAPGVFCIRHRSDGVSLFSRQSPYLSRRLPAPATKRCTILIARSSSAFQRSTSSGSQRQVRRRGCRARCRRPRRLGICGSPIGFAPGLAATSCYRPTGHLDLLPFSRLTATPALCARSNPSPLFYPSMGTTWGSSEEDTSAFVLVVSPGSGGAGPAVLEVRAASTLPLLWKVVQDCDLSRNETDHLHQRYGPSQSVPLLGLISRSRLMQRST